MLKGQLTGFLGQKKVNQLVSQQKNISKSIILSYFSKMPNIFLFQPHFDFTP